MSGVLIEDRGAVRILTIDRAEVHNAIDATIAWQLGDAMAAASDDDAVRVVVLTGAGTRAFCAGGDLKAIARGETYLHPTHPEWRFAGFVAHRIAKPVIAAVNGVAIGGGAELALACDIVLASDGASFAFPEVTHGAVAAAGGGFRLPRTVPRLIATELMLTGDRIDARRALDIHLVNRIFDAEHLVDESVAMGQRIARSAPLAVQAHLRLARGETIDGGRPLEQDGWQRLDAEWQALRGTDDAREGPRAFAEKRRPVWQGR